MHTRCIIDGVTVPGMEQKVQASAAQVSAAIKRVLLSVISSPDIAHRSLVGEVDASLMVLYGGGYTCPRWSGALPLSAYLCLARLGCHYAL